MPAGVVAVMKHVPGVFVEADAPLLVPFGFC
jgi:hypothetical protein